MSSKYAVILKQGSILPKRDFLISEAWGKVPVSYFQDQESLNDCTFIYLKINKWEINSQWSSQQDSEPWIRINILKGKTLKEYVQNEEHLLPIGATSETILVFELDDTENDLDEILLLRLVSVFGNNSKIYRWCDGFQEMGEDDLTSTLTKQDIHKRLIKCK